ncbi:MAG: D-alanine--D-alanine ligase [Clostridia bacterium]|nr:D-alanine--D-alanine ligase [Clostridia bacterium]
MNIAILAGGISSERDVSLSSGCKISNALRKKGHSTCVVDLYFGIKELPSDLSLLFKDEASGAEDYYEIPENPPSIEEIKSMRNDKCVFGPNVLKICSYADVTFVALHGGCGEDGRVQATFDMIGIKYTGSNYVGCAMAMDKEIAKRIAKDAGVPTAKYEIVKKKEDVTFNFPFVLKICDGGSSIGVYIVNNDAELEKAFTELKDYKGKIIAEEYIKGREFSVGVLKGESLPPIEIIPKVGFYDYKNKYQAGMTEEICPASLDEKETETIKELALKTHNALGLLTYSRTDFMRRGYNDFVMLETNTLPGMTKASLLPQEAKVIGIDYETLCDMIVKDAL